MNLIKLVSVFSLLIFLTGCYDNIDNSTERDVIAQPEIKVNTEIAGLVYNVDGTKLTNFSIKVGSKIQYFDGPYFQMELNSVNKIGQSIEVIQNDETVGFVQTNLIENDLNSLVIQRFHVLESAILDISVANEVVIDQNISINIPAGSTGGNPILSYGKLNMDNLLNSAYTRGNQLLKPFEFTVFMIQPGKPSLSESKFENPIQIKLKESTEEQSLFRYDVSSEKWIEITELMSGPVSLDMIYTGLFAVAKKNYGVTIQGKVQSSNSENISYQELNVHNGEEVQKVSSTLNAKWLVVVKEFSDIIVDLNNPCDEVVGQVDFSTQESSLINLDLTADDSGLFYNPKGTVLDCDGESIEKAALKIVQMDEEKHYFVRADTDGIFLPVCTSTFDISGIDLVNSKEGPSVPWTVNDDLSYLSSCVDHLEGYSFLKIRDDKEIYRAFTVQQIGQTTILRSEDGKLKLRIEGNTIGEYQDGSINIKIEDPDFGTTGYSMSCENPDSECGINNCEISHYNTGQKKWVRVLLEGELWMQTINPPQAGFFEVKGTILTHF